MNTGSQKRTVTDAQIETGSACGDSMVDLSCSQTNMFSIMADVHVKRRRIETTEISTETYDVTDYRPTQDELVAVDDFMVLNDIIIDSTDDRNCTVKTDDEQITTHDRIRQMLDRNYKKSVENTMRKYNKKVSKSNAKIEKGSFVTVGIPIVDRASGDLPRLLCRVDDIIGKDASLYKLSCEFGVLNACYG